MRAFWGDQVATLLAQADRGDKNVRNRVARELGLLKDPKAREAIAAATRSDVWQRRFAAVRAMRRWSADELLPAGELRHLLTDPAGSMRWATARVVAPRDRLDALGHLATSDPVPTVRQVAVLSLANVPEADGILAASLKDPDHRVRIAAVLSHRRRFAIEALNDLIPVLDDQYMRVRMAAIAAVAEVGGQGVVPTIIPLLHDRKRPVRNITAIVLARLGDGRAVDPLIGVLERATSTAMRSTALRALGRLDDRRAVNPVIAALRAAWTDDPWDAPDGQIQTRIAATKALQLLGGDDANRELQQLPKDWLTRVERLN